MMNKLIFVAVFFAQSLCAFEWIPTCYFGLDIDQECIFYDAYNDTIEIGTPRVYYELMYMIERPVVITHYSPMPERPIVKLPILECKE